MTTINLASREWATRPDDQRFLTLDALRESVAKRKSECWTVAPKLARLRVVADEQTDDLRINVWDSFNRQEKSLIPTHWGFSQVAAAAGAPASYLRKLPAPLAGINMQWGFENIAARDDGLILAQTNGDNKLRALTSTSYGRIWDLQVVDSVMRVNPDGRWQVPAASYSAANPKRATTLYASDRDVFIFLVDPNNPVTVGNEVLYRGFITYNSEVGSATFGLMTFLYRVVCDNRIIWGATNVQELKIRHTSGAPDRFAHEGARALRKYAEESTRALEQSIEKAQEFEIPGAADSKKTAWQDWLGARGFTSAQAKTAVDTAKAEEGEARSLWDIVNGITASARSLNHTDDRVDLEKKAGKLMDLVRVA